MRRTLAVVLALAAFVGACTSNEKPSSIPLAKAAGSVRVGVWMSPDPLANTYGGAAVRALTLPQLFKATPDGKWRADLVAPGSDQTGRNAKTARFRLRPNARWSDGTPITVADLRRTIDPRFVLAVDDPTRHGAIVVRFTQSLPGWRRLWSGLESVSPPKPGVWGGPYVVRTVTPNFETVLRVNPTYYGDAPTIRDVHLVLVPDPEIQARLMAKGELDVTAPPAASARTERLERIPHARVVRGSLAKGGWTAALVTNPTHLPEAQRLALLSLIDARRFATVLLANEATPTAPPAGPVAQTPPPTSAVPAVSSPYESSPASLLLRALQRSGHNHGVTFDLRQGEFDEVLGAYATSDFDMLIRLQPSTPETCWTCEAASVDAPLAAAADAHTPGARQQLEDELRNKGLVLPLWRERPVVAVRDRVENVTANGFSVAGPMWDIAAWRLSR